MKKTKKQAVRVDGEEIELTKSSGNVFADIGLREPEELQAKAFLTHQVAKLIKSKGLSQAKTAALLGITQPKVSRLLNGHLGDFSVESITRYLTRLGSDVVISVRNRPKAKGPGHVLAEVA